MQHPDHHPYTPAMTNREIMGRLLRIEHPDIDINDDEAVFGNILDDYADYARLIEAEISAGCAQRATAPDDGLPHLP